MMLKQTKIVASISDLRCDVDFIRELFDAGMNVVRMNTTIIAKYARKIISSVHIKSRMSQSRSISRMGGIMTKQP